MLYNLIAPMGRALCPGRCLRSTMLTPGALFCQISMEPVRRQSPNSCKAFLSLIHCPKSRIPLVSCPRFRISTSINVGVHLRFCSPHERNMPGQ